MKKLLNILVVLFLLLSNGTYVSAANTKATLTLDQTVLVPNKQKKITISGTTDKKATVKINGKKIKVTRGHFSYTYKVKKETKQIKVIATVKGKKKQSKTIKITTAKKIAQEKEKKKKQKELEKKAEQEREKQLQIEQEKKRIADEQEQQRIAEEQEQQRIAEEQEQRQQEKQNQEAARIQAEQEQQAQAIQDQKEQIVYIAPRSGTKYHFSQNCRGLSRAKSISSLSLSDAEAQGYDKCGFE